MIVTENEARDLECCGPQTAKGTIIVRCRGAGCMAWDWEDGEVGNPDYSEFKQRTKKIREELELPHSLVQKDQDRLVVLQDVYWKAKGYAINKGYLSYQASHRYTKPLLDKRRGGCGLVNLHVDVEVNN